MIILTKLIGKTLFEVRQQPNQRYAFEIFLRNKANDYSLIETYKDLTKREAIRAYKLATKQTDIRMQLE